MDLLPVILFFFQSKSSKEELLSMWGETLECEQDVWDVFHAYLTGGLNKGGKKVTKVSDMVFLSVFLAFSLYFSGSLIKGTTAIEAHNYGIIES